MKNYRHKVVIERVTQAQNGYGELTETWATLYTVWALITPKGGQEKVDGGATKTVARELVETWYRSGVTSKDRVKFGSRYLAIESVENVENRNRIMVLTCTETE